jgi:aminoglycoside 2'-N-acetyltransferase I
VAIHEVRRISTEGLTAAEVAAVRALLWSAFPPGEEGFTEDDWQHAIGGMHFVLGVERRIVSHASVIQRDLHVADRHLRTGYVEAVATSPTDRGMGFGSAVMQEVNDYIGAHFELGALGTGAHRFYERLGWVAWQGPTSVRTAGGAERTPGEDGFILVLRTPSTPPLDLTAPISCEWRPGDVW